MGLFPLKGRAAFLAPTRRTIEAMQELGDKATRAGLGSLEKLTQSSVATKASGVHLVPRDRVPALMAVHRDATVAAWFRFTGAMPGAVATFFTEDDARRMVDLLVGKAPGATRRIGDLEESALAEMTNIALNGALNHVADTYGLRFITEPPVVAFGPGLDLGFLSPAGGDAGEHALVVETSFAEPNSQTAGTLVVVFGIPADRESP